MAAPTSRTDIKYFDFHLDLRPAAAAALLHGDVVWQASSKGEWVAILRFPRVVDAKVDPRVAAPYPVAASISGRDSR